MKLKSRREPLLPIPKHRWDRKANQWVQDGTTPQRGRWERPILPPHPRLPRDVVMSDHKKPRPLGVMMRPEDVRRAEIVLALYLKSDGITTYEQLRDAGPGFEFLGYPGWPVNYSESEVERVLCCNGDTFRTISPDKPLRNPVRYFFCQHHWYRMLRESAKRDESLSIPDLETRDMPQSDDSTTRGCLSRRVENYGTRVHITSCRAKGRHTVHRYGASTWRDPKPEYCHRTYHVSKTETHTCLRSHGHRGPCGPGRGVPQPISTPGT